jgi:hypothetical protein
VFEDQLSIVGPSVVTITCSLEGELL